MDSGYHEFDKSEPVEFEPPVIPTLTANVPVAGEIPATGGSEWYQVPVVSGDTVYVWVTTYNNDPSSGYTLGYPSVSGLMGSEQIYMSSNGEKYSHDTPVESAGTFYIRVQSYSDGGTYGIMYNTTGILPLTPPAYMFTGSVGHAWTIGVSWGSVDGAEKYNVYRSDSEDGDYAKIGESLTTDYEDVNVTSETDYWYKVSSENTVEGESAQSIAYKFTATKITALTADVWAYAYLSPNTKQYSDWFSFEVVSGQTYYLYGTHDMQPAYTWDINGYTYYSDETPAYSQGGSPIIIFSISPAGNSVNFTAAQTGTVYVEIKPSYWNRTGSAYLDLAYSQSSTAPVKTP